MWSRSKVKPRSGRSGGSSRRFAAEAEVGRTKLSGSKAFAACVWVGSGRKPTIGNTGRMTGASVRGCGNGQNPRQALANALIAAGKNAAKRKGAFAGL